MECYTIFDSCDPVKLDAFIAKYRECNIDSISQYADGLSKDYDAVRNSLLYNEISNGPLEGMNTRVKMVHRRGSGRAGTELLNAYMVLSFGENQEEENISLDKAS